MYYVRWSQDGEHHEVGGDWDNMWRILWKVTYEMWDFPESGIRGVTFGFEYH